MRFVKVLSIFILLTSFTITGFGQDTQIQKSTEKIRIDGNIFYVHNVKKGETIYSLTKAYGISEDDLVRINPELANGLKDGQILRIPEKPIQVSTHQKTVPKSNGLVEHEVQRKETLYSISRQYNVSVDDIKKANPTIDENIKKGQILYIPGQSAKTESQHTIVPIRHEQEGDDMAGEHIYHSVRKSETLYSIAQQYSVSESVIRSLNDDAFKNGSLMEGAILRIPKYEVDKLDSGVKVLFPGYTYQATDAPAPINTYHYNHTDVFNVVFLLPISAKEDSNTLIEVTSSTNGNRKVNRHLEFYEGALLAMDSLKKAGLSLNVSTFDISDSQSLNTALQNSSTQQAQLIIAPVQNNLVDILSDFAQRRQIPIVLPVSNYTDSTMAYNPYIIQLRSSESATNHKLTHNICQADRNIILINHAGRDTTLYYTYNSFLKQSGCNYSTLNYTIAKSRASLQSSLSATKENHIVVASTNDLPFVMDVLETLNVSFSKNKIKSHVYGSADWRKMNMNSLQLTYLYNLNLHLAVPFYVNYNDDDTKVFINKYRYFYKGEPSNYSFYGYDICFYFLDCLKTYGRNFVPFLPSNKKDMLQSRFQFRQIGYGGMRNEGVFLLDYQPDLSITRK